MKSLLFYLIIALILIAFASLFVHKRQHAKKNKMKRRMPLVDFGKLSSSNDSKVQEKIQISKETEKQTLYDPSLIILQLNAFPGQPYMGYELHQSLLSSGLRFGDMNIFHKYDNGDKGNILFSLAAATKSGVFHIEDMGGFKCAGLMMFMRMDPKQKLMASFDLMLDTARQLTEELGGDIYDDLQQTINAEGIKRLREKICEVETKNMYASDLLDNLD